MNSFRFLSGFCLLLFVLGTVGCGCRPPSGSTTGALIQEGAAAVDASEREKETFDGEIENLSALENSPGLPGTPGADVLIQAADRLDKWIRDRSPDDDWQGEETFLALEKDARKTADTAGELVRLLQLIQEKEVLDERGNPVKVSETLDTEWKRVVELLDRLVSELNGLGRDAGIPDIAPVAQNIVQLRDLFSSLETTGSMNARRIRAFAKQRETETRQLNALAENLDRFASELQIDGLFVRTPDVDYLKQCIWSRDIALWGRGKKQEPLERAKHLFDWTVCNIDLKDGTVPFGPDRRIELPQQFPWQTMLLGYGTVWDRIWVFVELLRQQRIDACLLAVPHPEQADFPLIWAVGVLSEGEIYLFIPMYGMPLPGSSGPALAEDGSLAFDDIATLSQVLKDDGLLRQLDFPGDAKFPITSKMLQNTNALLLAAPETVSLRMKVMENELSGEQNTVLYTNIQRQLELFRGTEGLKSVEIWKYPLRTKFKQILLSSVTTELMGIFTVPNPKRGDFPLWAGRILYFKGMIQGQDGAMLRYQNARVPDREIMEYRNSPEFRNDPRRELMFRLVSANAGYWLGQAAFEIDSLAAASDFLVPLETNPNNLWRGSIQYTLGRIAERNKDYAEAARRFEAAADGPKAGGNRLRARWVRQAVGLTDATAE